MGGFLKSCLPEKKVGVGSIEVINNSCKAVQYTVIYIYTRLAQKWYINCQLGDCYPFSRISEPECFRDIAFDFDFFQSHT